LGKIEPNLELAEKFLQSRVLLYFVILLLFLKVFTLGILINFPQNVFFADITKSALEILANQTRQSLGLNALVENPKLNEAARLKAEDMVRNQYFSHTSPTGVTPWFWFSKAGYDYKYAGENLAIGFFGSNEVFNAWLNSPSHRQNLVNPNYKEIGTAVLEGFGQNSAVVVVQFFGALKPAKSVVADTKPAERPLQPAEPPESTTHAETDTNLQEAVLAQTTEVLQEDKNTGLDNPYFRFLNFVLYGQYELLQNVVYGVSLVVAGVLLAVIFFNFDIVFKRGFVFRSLVLIVLLSLAVLINEQIVVLIIPHQVVI